MSRPRSLPTRRRAAVALALALALGGCSADDDELLAAHDLSGMSGAEVVDVLDALPVAERPSDLMASVRYDSVVLSSPTTETELPIEGDRFYVSVAPYVDQTHDCYFHSLTTCRGELPATEMHVTVTEPSGEVLVDEDLTTFDNGFAGIWLPRDIEATLTVTYDGRTGEIPVSTGPDDPTCLTGLRLTGGPSA